MKNFIMLIIAATVGFAVFSFLEKESAPTPTSMPTQQSGGDAVQQILDAKSPLERSRLINDEIARRRQEQLKMQEVGERIGRENEERKAAIEKEREWIRAEREALFNAVQGK